MASLRLKQAFALGVGGEATGIAIAFLVSVLVVRYIGISAFGIYQILIAAAYFCVIGTSSLDQIIVRFHNDVQRNEWPTIIRSILLSKSIGFFSIALIEVAVWFLTQELAAIQKQSKAVGNFEWLAFFAYSQVFFSHLTATPKSLLQRKEKFGWVIGIQLANSILDLSFVLYLAHAIYLDPAKGIFWLAGARALVSAFTWTTITILSRDYFQNERVEEGECARVGFSFRLIWDPRWRKYIGPIQILELMNYLKQFFPVVLTGFALGAHEAGKVRIILQLFDAAHKIIPKSLSLVFPSLVNTWKRDPHTFERKMRGYGICYVGVILIGSGLIILFGREVYSLWKIPFEKIDAWFLCFMGVELVVLAAAQIELQFLMFGKDMRIMLFSSPIRQSLRAGLTVWLVSIWGILGVAIGRLVGTLWMWIAFAWGNQKQAGRSANEANFLATIVAVAIFLVLAITILSEYQISRGHL